MVGAGSHVFAVMGYVIAKQVPDRVNGSWVELNPKLLAFILGDTEARIQEAIDFLCKPDARTRTEGHEGRRLVQVGQYAYKVVNGAKYRAIRDEEARRESNREAKRREREKKKGLPGIGIPLAGELEAMKAISQGDVERCDQIAATRATQLK